MSDIDAVNRARIKIAELLKAEIAKAAGEPLHFTLFVWDTGKPGTGTRFSYVSTHERATTADLLAHVVRRWAEAPDLMPSVPAQRQ